MKIFVWPYSKKNKSMIINEGVENNRFLLFHNPARVREQIEYIKGDIREYIPSFDAAKEKFSESEGPLHVFHLSEDPKSLELILKVFKKNKVRFDLMDREYPL